MQAEIKPKRATVESIVISSMMIGVIAHIAIIIIEILNNKIKQPFHKLFTN